LGNGTNLGGSKRKKKRKRGKQRTQGKKIMGGGVGPPQKTERHLREKDGGSRRPQKKG